MHAMPPACPGELHALRYIEVVAFAPECPRLVRGIVTLFTTVAKNVRLPRASRRHLESAERRRAVAKNVRLPRASRGHLEHVARRQARPCPHPTEAQVSTAASMATGFLLAQFFALRNGVRSGRLRRTIHAYRTHQGGARLRRAATANHRQAEGQALRSQRVSGGRNPLQRTNRPVPALPTITNAKCVRWGA